MLGAKMEEGSVIGLFRVCVLHRARYSLSNLSSPKASEFSSTLDLCSLAHTWYKILCGNTRNGRNMFVPSNIHIEPMSVDVRHVPFEAVVRK